MAATTNQTYTYSPTSIAVTGDFAESIDQLRSLGITPQYIIDIYIESQKYAQGIRAMENPMRYIESCEGHGSPPDIRFRQMERIYKEVVKKWSKLKPSEFIHEYETYVEQRPNNSGIENGIVSQIFFRFTGVDNHTLVVDPSPSFVIQQQQYNKNLKYTFTDDRYCEIYSQSAEKSNVAPLEHLGVSSYDRVLYFARDSTPEQIQQVLETLRPALVKQTSSNIYILMPTMYLEKRHSEGALWNYLTENYTIFKLVLMDQRAVCEKRKKQCMIVLQNTPAKNCREILVQKTRLVGKNTIESLEFRRIPYNSFADRDRTLSEMYNSDFTDYSQPSRRNKPIEYKYSSEISIWISLTNKDGKYRPYYSLYDYPTNDQKRKNTLLRGKPLKTRIPGKWYDTKGAAIASAEYVLQDKVLANIVRQAVIKQYLDEDKSVSLKTLLFIYFEQISGSKVFDEGFCNSIFFRPHSAATPLCSFVPGVATADEIIAILSDYIKENSLSANTSDSFLKQIELLYDYAVIARFCPHNPIRRLRNDFHRSNKQTAGLRRAMVKRSFSVEEEARFLSLLLNDDRNPEKALATLVRYYTGLPLNQLCALTRGDYIIDPDLNLSMLAITKEFPYRTLTAVSLAKGKRRLVPLVRPVADRIYAKFQSQGSRSNSAPLFTKPGNSKEPLTPRQLREYYNRIADQLEIPEIKLAVDVEHSSQATTDISDYKGDFLRSNYDFHARHDTSLETESINYLTGRKLETTEGQYYCDYSAKLMQLLMRVQLDQWAARYFAPNPSANMVPFVLDQNAFMYSPIASNRHTRTRIELDIDPSASNTEANILLEVFARFGGSLSFCFYSNNQEVNDGKSIL